jgi:CheY-like chemotaxis protein
VPAIALTAFARESDRFRALGAGFNDHLAKPVQARTLIEKAAEIAGRP